MTPARRKGMALAAIAALAGGVLLAWSQPWFEVGLDSGDIVVGGDAAAGALVPLALAALALVAALALAGPFFRVLLAVLHSMLGLCVGVVSVFALVEPVVAVRDSVTDATGVGGDEAVADLILALNPTAWPGIAVGLGAAQLVLGIVLAATLPGWPASRSRYERTRLAAADGDAIAEWDALSAGDDPTEDPEPDR